MSAAEQRSEAAVRAALSEGRTVELDPLLRERVADRAAREGLVEVAYAEVDSPLGVLVAAATERGLVRLSFPDPPIGEILGGLAADIGSRVVELPSRFDVLRRELEEYFDGARRQFDLALDWQLTSGFTRRVLVETAAIPYGGTRTYAEIAREAGSPRAHRAAGGALGANPLPIVVPCHRVLRTGGALGGYGGGLDAKRTLLRLEGALD